jgi:hypothetical protein
MEEQQIHNFVHRVSTDETLRQHCTNNPDEVIARQHFTPAVARVVARLVPHLTLHKEGPASDVSLSWWF